MTIIRDDKRIARLRTFGLWANFVGLGVLIVGLLLPILISDPRMLYVQLAAIPLGWLLSQVGIYLTHRYLQDPRPDEVLDDALKKVAKDGRMYHYVLPASHVLLTPSGPIVFVAKYQVGNISYKDGKWRQTRISFIRKLFGQEGLGDPTREADRELQKLVNFIRKQAPEVEEVPVGVMIIFTKKAGSELDVTDSPIPAMHFTKLKGAFKQRTQGPPLPSADYAALRAAFDRAAGKLVAEVS